MTIDVKNETFLMHCSETYVMASNALMNDLLEPLEAMRLEKLRDEMSIDLAFILLESLGYSFVDNERGLGCKWQKTTK